MNMRAWQYKVFLFFLISMLEAMLQLSAQQRIITTFKCENFNNEGTTAFIELVQENNTHQFYYYTSQSPKKLFLKIQQASSTTQHGGAEQYRVQFPNDEAVFTIVLKKGGLSYITTQGKEHQFCIVGLNCD